MEPTRRISAVADVMGEILDSFYVKDITAQEYLTRTSLYMDRLGTDVDIWEVGNETNGEWLGDTATAAQKVSGSYDRVKAKGYRAALTLYYNEECWARSDHEMFTWTEANLPSRMKSGLDFVWVSFYEDDCNGIQPNWDAVFQRLATIFPNSKIGFGEVGTKYADKKRSYLEHYYSMKVNAPRYVGGHFWWYYRQDMVPWGGALWNDLDSIMRASMSKAARVATPDLPDLTGLLQRIWTRLKSWF